MKTEQIIADILSEGLYRRDQRIYLRPGQYAEEQLATEKETFTKYFNLAKKTQGIITGIRRGFARPYEVNVVLPKGGRKTMWVSAEDILDA